MRSSAKAAIDIRNGPSLVPPLVADGLPVRKKKSGRLPDCRRLAERVTLTPDSFFL